MKFFIIFFNKLLPYLNIWYIFFVTRRPGRALLLILLALRLLASHVSYDVSFFVAKIFVRGRNIGVASAQTLRQST